MTNHYEAIVVGTSADTPSFAVDAIAMWVRRCGRRWYPNARELLILCDNGGSNGCRNRLWKLEIQRKLSDRFGIAVTVAHYPPGTSKWNPIEHRMFSAISNNLAGQPLRGSEAHFETLVKYIATTTTQKGLRITATFLAKQYSKGITVTDEQMKSLNIRRPRTLPAWNYTILPRQFGRR